MSVFNMKSVVGGIFSKVFGQLILAFLAFCLIAYLTSKVGGWLSEKFSSKPTVEQLQVANGTQKVANDALELALENKDGTIQTVGQLSEAAVKSLEDSNKGRVETVTTHALAQQVLTRAALVNQAEIVRIKATSTDTVQIDSVITKADQALAVIQDSEIENAYFNALKRSNLSTPKE